MWNKQARRYLTAIVPPLLLVPVAMLACYAGGQVWARLHYRYWAL